MVIDILNPIEIIMALFGNLYFFAAVIILIYLLAAGKYRFNIQLTVMGATTIFLMLSLLEEGFSDWIVFIIVGIAMFSGYVFWRYMATK